LSYAPWFFMGAAAYFQRKKSRLPQRWYYVALAIVVGTALTPSLLIGVAHTVWVDLAICAAFCFGLTRFEEISCCALRRACHLVAKYSYGVYLAHVPILWLTLQHAGSRYTAGPMADYPVLVRGTAFVILMTV